MSIELGFWEFARQHPNHVAVVDVDGSRVTADALWRAANQLAHGLRALGLTPGDAVASVMPNHVACLELFLAATQIGLYVTPVNWHLTAPEVAYILQDSGAKVLVCSGESATLSHEAANLAELPHAARFLVGDTPDHAADFRPLSDLKDGASIEPPENRTAGGPMTYTSGTTGHPKGVRRPLPEVEPEVVSSQQALFLALFGIMPGSAGVHLVVAPLYHTAVLNFATNHLHLGHTLVLMEPWDAEHTLRLIERHAVTSSHMVPTMFHRMLKLPPDTRQRYDLSSLSHVIHSAAPCPIDTKRAMLDWWGPCIYEYYAASEGGGTLATPDDWARKPGTVGKPWPISEIRILDDEQRLAPSGEIGTVWIRMGDHRFEYHKDESKTREAWHEGFFTVGDAGYLDDDGFLFLCDRKADMIISGGVNIYPAEIEAALIGHPKVADVAVFGVPDDDWGEQVKAVIVAIDDAQDAATLQAELAAYLQDKLAKFKRPRSMDFVSSLPRDPSGKLFKRKLRDPYWQGRERAI
jgi:long-chain acyl-CoA synthetase